ncbi:PadR family transcriptional regulator [candidate division KSB1 bacterium]
MDILTRIEEIYLLAIWKLQDNAYGVTIKKKVTEMTGKIVSYGALYFTLDQLNKKGYVIKNQGDPTPVRGGCAKIFYILTPVGKKALKTAHELQSNIWDGVSSVIFDESHN